MAGETSRAAGESGSTGAPFISIQINLGSLLIKYDGPPEFLDKLPGIIAELAKFGSQFPPVQLLSKLMVTRRRHRSE